MTDASSLISKKCVRLLNIAVGTWICLTLHSGAPYRFRNPSLYYVRPWWNHLVRVQLLLHVSLMRVDEQHFWVLAGVFGVRE